MLTALRLFAPGNPASPFSLPPFLPSSPQLRICRRFESIIIDSGLPNRATLRTGAWLRGEERTDARSIDLFFSFFPMWSKANSLRIFPSFEDRSIVEFVLYIESIISGWKCFFFCMECDIILFIYYLFLLFFIIYLFFLYTSWSRSFISLLSSRKVCSKIKVEEDERLSKNYLSRFYFYSLLLFHDFISHLSNTFVLTQRRPIFASSRRKLEGVGIRAQLQSRVAAEINSHRDNSRGQGLVASYYRRGEAARRWRPINNLLFSETGEESVGPL